METYQLPLKLTDCVPIGGKGYNSSEAPLVRNGKLYWCGVSHTETEGNFLICQLDLTTGAFISKIIRRTDNVAVDDHNSGGLVLGPDGHILYAVKGHGGDPTRQFLQYGRSTNPEDISSFVHHNTVRRPPSTPFPDGELIECDGFAYDIITAGYYSGEYSSIHRLSAANNGNGRTYIFGRRYIQTPYTYNWVCYGYSDDDFVNPITPRGDYPLTQGLGGIFGSNTTNRIYIAFFRGGASLTLEEAGGIWFAQMDENGIFRNANDDIILDGNGQPAYDFDTLPYNAGVVTTGVGIPQSAMTEVFLTPPADPPLMSASPLQVTHDAGGKPLVVYHVVDSTVLPATMTAYTAVWRNGAWRTATVCNTGRTINSVIPTTNNGSLVSVDENDPTTIYASREQVVGGGEWEIERYVTLDDYVTWTPVENLTAADTSLAKKLARPVVAKGAPGQRIVLFTEFTSRVSYTNWSGFNHIYREVGPQITGWKQTGTKIDVPLLHDGGTDFTPTTGITGFTALDAAGNALPVESAVRLHATMIRLMMSAETAVANLRYLYGRNPEVSGIVKDNSALALPMEYYGSPTYYDLAPAFLANTGAPVAGVVASDSRAVGEVGIVQEAYFDLAAAFLNNSSGKYPNDNVVDIPSMGILATTVLPPVTIAATCTIPSLGGVNA